MFKFFYIFLLFCFSISPIFAADLGKTFQMNNPVPAQLQNKKVQVAPGVAMQVGDFIVKSNLKTAPTTKPFFNRDFEQRFLLQPAEYTEEVKATGDRLVVTRTLIIEPKDPCDPLMDQYGAMSLCFKKSSKQKQISKTEEERFHKEMNLVRQKAKKIKSNDPETLKVLKMDDDTLFDYLINKRSKRKKIIQTSRLPLAVYKNIRSMQPINLLTPNFTVPAQGQYKPAFKKNAALISAAHNMALDNNKILNKPTVARELSFKDYKKINDYEQPDPITFQTNKEEKYNMLLGSTWGIHDGDYKEIEFAEEGWFTDRYYARFTYSFGFGFGLRWPFELTVNSNITDVEDLSGHIKPYPQRWLCDDVESNDRASECSIKSDVSFKVKGVNADNSFYIGTGLPSEKVFEGKEFVFTAQANMRFYISIPGPNISYKPDGVDFDYGEHFTPPLGSQSARIVDFILKPNQTGLKISGNIGVAEVYGGLDIGAFITANNGQFKMMQWGEKSRNTCPDHLVFNSVDDVVTCQATENIPSNTSSKWGLNLQLPRYKTDFVITPQVGLRIGVWVMGWDWDYSPGTVALTALSVDLGTYNFVQHEGTVASFIYEIAKRTKK